MFGVGLPLARDNRQDRIADGVEGLRDQGRADRARGVAAAEGDQAAPQARRHRDRKEVPREVQDVLQVVLVAKPLHRILNHALAVLRGQVDRTANADSKPTIGR